MEIHRVSLFDDVIRQAMRARIEQKAEEIAGEYKAKALADLDVAIRKAVTDTAVEFSRMVILKNNGHEITIRIEDRRAVEK